MDTQIDTAAPGYQQLDAPLTFTEAAAAKVRELISEEGNADLKLRVYIPVSYTHLDVYKRQVKCWLPAKQSGLEPAQSAGVKNQLAESM